MRKAIHVLHLLDTAAPGGRQQMVLDLCSGMGHGEFCFTALFRLGPGILQAEFERAGIETLAWEGAWDEPEQLANWAALLGQRQFDIIHTHPAPAGFHAAAKSVINARIVAHLHNLSVSHHEADAVLLAGESLAHSDLCLVTTPWLERTLGQACGPDAPPIRVLPPGIDAGRFAGGNRAAMRRAFGFPESAFIVGTVSRLVWNKNIETLLHAFAQIAGDLPEMVLLIVGDGPLRGELEELACWLGLQGRVRFSGWQRNIPQILSGLDLFALASWNEGFGLSRLEAMAAGIPVLLSDLPSLRGLLPAALRQYMIPPAQVEVWAGQMRRLAGDANLRQTLVAEQQRVVSEYSLCLAQARLEDIYASLMSGGDAGCRAASVS